MKPLNLILAALLFVSHTTYGQGKKQLVKLTRLTNTGTDTVTKAEILWDNSGKPDKIIVSDYTSGNIAFRTIQSNFKNAVNPKVNNNTIKNLVNTDYSIIKNWSPSVYIEQKLQGGNWSTLSSAALKYDNALPTTYEWSLADSTTSYKTEYYHDSKGNYNGMTEYMYKSHIKESEYGKQYIYKYEGEKIISTEYPEPAGTSQWKEEYQYNANNEIAAVVRFDRSNNDMKWHKRDSAFVTWRNFNPVRSVIYSGPFAIGGNQFNVYENYKYDDTNKAWVKNLRQIKTYNENGQIVNYLEQYATTVSWSDYSKTDWEYYSNGTPKSLKHSSRKSNVWEVSVLEEYDCTFDEDEDILTMMVTRHTLWDVSYYYHVYEYDIIGVGVNALDKSSPVIYPNPARDMVSVKLDKINTNATVAIFDMSGKPIYSVRSIQTNHINLDISGFAKGIYIIAISSDEVNLVRRLVKE